MLDKKKLYNDMEKKKCFIYIVSHVHHKYIQVKSLISRL